MGNFNTGIGAGTLALNIADENTATGTGALLFNTTGFQNTASGAFALFNNGIGNFNTAIGFQALFSNTEGLSNTAIGVQALQNNTTGSVNTAIGIGALISNTIGSGNIALGNGAGFNVTTGNFNIAIGNFGFADDSQTIRIGTDQTKTFIAGIRGITTGNNNAVSVVIDSAGQLGTMSSSRRFKKEIKPMDKASEAILALKPVTFHYKSDKTNTPHFGLIAEEVAEVDPDLVVRDDNGEIYTVRYDQVNAMLLNEFLKEHRAFVEEQLKVAEQQKEIDAFKEELKEQRYLIQKVSDRIELKRSAPQTVANNP
ncbi:MAG: tail fiber domain-containing protein [Candidatus Udaeobacter sp.]